MSAFREAAKLMLQEHLQCPGCTAMNRPGVVYIEASFDFETAVCTVCSVSGPIAKFQPPKV
jgi:hypothetical protein